MANGEVEIHTDVNRPCCRSCRTRAFVKLKSTSMDSRRVGQVASSASCIEVSFRVGKRVNLGHFIYEMFISFFFTFNMESIFYRDCVAKDLCQKTCDEQCWRPKLGLQGDVEASLHKNRSFYVFFSVRSCFRRCLAWFSDFHISCS